MYIVYTTHIHGIIYKVERYRQHQVACCVPDRQLVCGAPGVRGTFITVLTTHCIYSPVSTDFSPRYFKSM